MVSKLKLIDIENEDPKQELEETHEGIVLVEPEYILA